METEIWKDIPWYEWKYQASNLWNIQSINFRRRWYPMIHRLQKDWWWYLRATLCMNWKQKKLSAHRIIALTFIWESLLQVNHKDWNKENNCIHNLEYCTWSENVLHSFDSLWRKWSSTWKFWSQHHNSIAVSQYTKKWKLVRKYGSQMEAMRITWISNAHIWDCIAWRAITAWWFYWRIT